WVTHLEPRYMAHSDRSRRSLSAAHPVGDWCCSLYDPASRRLRNSLSPIRARTLSDRFGRDISRSNCGRPATKAAIGVLATAVSIAGPSMRNSLAPRMSPARARHWCPSEDDTLASPLLTI